MEKLEKFYCFFILRTWIIINQITILQKFDDYAAVETHAPNAFDWMQWIIHQVKLLLTKTYSLNPNIPTLT